MQPKISQISWYLCAHNAALDKVAEKEAKKSEVRAPLKKIWALNRPELGWIVLGLVGTLIVGSSMPVQGVVIAYVQVSTDHVFRLVARYGNTSYVFIARC